jgi:hypothetical protein
MARIRTIKPDFWTNEKVLSIKPLTRLLFIGMWNFADDYGRMDYAPLGIKAKVFPNDAIAANDVRDMLNELCSADLIIVYSANGKEYIEITGWDHQRIDRRQPSKIPAPFAERATIVPAPLDEPPTPFDEHSTNPPDHSTSPAPVREGNGREGSGMEGKKETREGALVSVRHNDFEVFWLHWPNKVGKPAALKAFASAQKRGAQLDAVLDGVDNYIRDKPPDRPWLNPATFLNQNRWEDQPAKVENGKTGSSIIAAADRAIANLEREIALDNESRSAVVLSLPSKRF